MAEASEPRQLLNEMLCTQCRGKCCNRMPGCAAPEDFGEAKEERMKNVRHALRSGYWQLDCWEGLVQLPVSKREVNSPFFIRPRPLDGQVGVFNFTWGGRCIFLGLRGCKLPAGKRPFECRLLEPMPGDEKCVPHYVGKLTVAEMWLDAGIDLNGLGEEVQDGRDKADERGYRALGQLYRPAEPVCEMGDPPPGG